MVCVGQPLLIVGDLNADPGVIPCFAKGISSGRFVDLALACSLGAGGCRMPLANLSLMSVVGLVGTVWLVAPMLWLRLLLPGLLIGGSLLTSL